MYKSVESLMSDILFKETLASESNRKQLEFLLEQLLEFPEHSLSGKLKVKYESPLKKLHIREKMFEPIFLWNLIIPLLILKHIPILMKKHLRKVFII